MNFLFSDVPDSKTFDISLMITLLRNLTKIGHPSGGFDCLPNSMETSSFADLARLKYYRNYLAHLGDANGGNTEFNNAWDNISGVGIASSIIFQFQIYSINLYDLQDLHLTGQNECRTYIERTSTA